MDRECKSCMWWERQPGQATGLCRYGPPRVLPAAMMAPWPTTRAKDWCGEFVDTRPPQDGPEELEVIGV